MVCHSETSLGHDDGNLRMPGPATAVLPNHHDTMLSRLKRLSEMTERAVSRNIRNRLPVHNQGRARFRFPDDFRDASVKLVAGDFQNHILRLALRHQGELGNFTEFARFFLGVGSQDRKSTRLNSSHSQISYAVFCLKKKNMQYYPVALAQLAPLPHPTTPHQPAQAPAPVPTRPARRCQLKSLARLYQQVDPAPSQY